ncbi:MAG TPA: YtxH domain-containing protein [Anaerolineales bacterium]|nr:YtxH domain-containing protein [Anaerolineales bacterium]
MIHKNQEYEYPTSNIPSVFVGILIGGLAGAVTMLLLAPQSGKDTRMQIREKGIELRDRTTEMVEDTVAQVRSNANKITMSGREKIKDLKQHGQEMAVEQLDRVSEAAQAGRKAIQSS